MSHTLQQQFGTEKRWVNWRYVMKEGRITKVPVGKNGSLARSNDSATWMTFEDARAKSENVGLMCLPDKKTLMVDFDNCITEGKITGSISKQIIDFAKKAKTYCELSPSGNGLHFIFSLEDPLELVANKKTLNETEKIECYTSGRFFTITNDFYGTKKPVKARMISTKEASSLLSILGYPWDKSTEVVETKASAISLSDQEITQKMFASKNGAKIRALYDGDISAYSNDESSADMAFADHLAFWTGKNPAQMESIWLSSPLGSRKKTQGRKDYRNRTIAAAIKSCKESYSVRQDAPISYESPVGDRIEFLTDAKDKILVITENIFRLLSLDSRFKNQIRYDEFKGQYEIFEANISKWRPIEDNDDVVIQGKISTLYPPFRMVNKNMVHDAIVKVAKENRFDSAADFIRSLKWDKIPRLDTWLNSVYGAPIDEYHRAVGSNWLKGMVKRLIDPGCKFDYVMVLEGPQGSKKSTSLYTLGGPWHVETTMTTDTKDFFMQFAGKSIIEFSEGETLSRTEVKRLKAIITMQSDRYRVPYERASADFPRRCVFAMTTNEKEYLKDDTGNRRWLPVALMLPEANVEWIEKNREQLFAEAYHRITALKETVYEFPKEATLEAQQERKVRDPNTDLLIHWYTSELKVADRESGITVSQAHKAINGGYIHKALTKLEEMNIASIFRDALKLEKRQVMKGGYRLMRWFRPEGQPDPMEGIEISVLDQLRDF